MARNIVARIGCLTALMLLAGCAETDPYLRPGQWQPTGVNTLNLSAMVVRPTDLIRGRGAAGSPAIEAATPVARYWAGKPTPLPSTNSQASGGAGQGGGGGGGGASAGGAAGAN